MLWANMHIPLSFLTFFQAAVFATSPSSEKTDPSTYTAQGAFPTSVYSKYFNSPTATSAQVQPGDRLRHIANRN